MEAAGQALSNLADGLEAAGSSMAEMEAPGSKLSAAEALVHGGRWPGTLQPRRRPRWKLFTAYQTTTGDRREMSEIWITDGFVGEWFPEAAPAEALAALAAVTQEASLHLLEPLPYSKAR